MKTKTPTLNEATALLEQQIARGSNTMHGTGGEIKGWRQMQRDLGQLREDFCRFDAVGRMSTADMDTLDEAISRLRAAGKIGPTWNGYLTIR